MLRLILLALWASTAMAQDVEPVWFKVGRTMPIDGRNETFLLALTDPDQIEQARVLADLGPGHGVGDIVFGMIRPGSDGFNRDLDAPGQPLWNWHIVKFLGFADAAVELCDGWPGFIEEDPWAFVLNTSNQLCFWSFTVVAEVEAPAYGIHPGLSGTWFDPATDGQGMFITIDRDIPLILVGWFTFDDLATPDVTGQRWYTAQGPYTSNDAVLDLSVTTGGRFDAGDPVMRSKPGSAGSLELEFFNCNEGTATYRWVSGTERTIPIQRLPAVENC